MGGISQIQISVDTFKIMMKKEKRKTLTEIRKKKCDFALGFCLFVCFRCIKVKQPCSTCTVFQGQGFGQKHLLNTSKVNVNAKHVIYTQDAQELFPQLSEMTDFVPIKF